MPRKGQRKNILEIVAMSEMHIKTNSKAAMKWIKEHGGLSTLRSPTFQKLRECPVCHATPAMPLYVPEEGKRGTCMFCDCPADIVVSRWFEDYKRFGEEKRGWLKASICENCLGYYLDGEKHLIFSDLLTDTGAV